MNIQENAIIWKMINSVQTENLYTQKKNTERNMDLSQNFEDLLQALYPLL